MESNNITQFLDLSSLKPINPSSFTNLEGLLQNLQVSTNFSVNNRERQRNHDGKDYLRYNLILRIEEATNLQNPREEDIFKGNKRTIGLILKSIDNQSSYRAFEYKRIEAFKGLKKRFDPNTYLLVKRGTLIRRGLLFLTNTNTHILNNDSNLSILIKFFK